MSVARVHESGTSIPEHAMRRMCSAYRRARSEGGRSGSHLRREADPTVTVMTTPLEGARISRYRPEGRQ